MPYLLGNWATDRRATRIAGQLGTADLYQTCLIFYRATRIGQRPVGVVVNSLVGMGLNADASKVGVWVWGLMVSEPVGYSPCVALDVTWVNLRWLLTLL